MKSHKTDADWILVGIRKPFYFYWNKISNRFDFQLDRDEKTLSPDELRLLSRWLGSFVKERGSDEVQHSDFVVTDLHDLARLHGEPENNGEPGESQPTHDND